MNQLSMELIWPEKVPEEYRLPTELQTIPMAFNFFAQRYSHLRYLGERISLPPGHSAIKGKGTHGSYNWLSFTDTARAVSELVRGISSIGVTAGDRVAILSSNRADWLIADYAIQFCGAVTCALSTSLDVDNLDFILTKIGCSTIFISIEMLPLFSKLRLARRFRNVILLDSRAEDRVALLQCWPEHVFKPTFVSTELVSEEDQVIADELWLNAFKELGNARFFDCPTCPEPIRPAPTRAENWALPDDYAGTDREELGKLFLYKPSDDLQPLVARGFNTSFENSGPLPQEVQDFQLSFVTHTLCGLREYGRWCLAPAERAQTLLLPVVPALQPCSTCTMLFTHKFGSPKAVCLSHTSILSSAMAVCTRMDTPSLIWPHIPCERVINYLNLSHIFARSLQFVSLFGGFAEGFARGSAPILFNSDISILHPTVFPVLPRVVDRIHESVMNHVINGPTAARKLFKHQMKSKIARFEHDHDEFSSLDKVILGTVRSGLGGKVKLVLCESGDLDPEAVKWFKALVCPNFVQLYTPLEAGGTGFMQLHGTRSCDNVGPLLANAEAKIVSFGSYNVNANPPAGQLLLRGPGVFSGYYHDIEATLKVLNDDGWLATGDVAEFHFNVGDDFGSYAKIVDHTESYLTIGDELINLEHVETILSNASYVRSVLVSGVPGSPTLVALVVPSASLASDVNVDVREVSKSQAAVEALLQSLRAAATSAGFSKASIPSAVVMLSQDWSLDTDLTAAEPRVRRNRLRSKHFSLVNEVCKAIDRMKQRDMAAVYALCASLAPQRPASPVIFNISRAQTPVELPKASIPVPPPSLENAPLNELAAQRSDEAVTLVSPLPDQALEEVAAQHPEDAPVVIVPHPDDAIAELAAHHPEEAVAELAAQHPEEAVAELAAHHPEEAVAELAAQHPEEVVLVAEVAQSAEPITATFCEAVPTELTVVVS